MACDPAAKQLTKGSWSGRGGGGEMPDLGRLAVEFHGGHLCTSKSPYLISHTQANSVDKQGADFEASPLHTLECTLQQRVFRNTLAARRGMGCGGDVPSSHPQARWAHQCLLNVQGSLPSPSDTVRECPLCIDFGISADSRRSISLHAMHSHSK